MAHVCRNAAAAQAAGLGAAYYIKSRQNDLCLDHNYDTGNVFMHKCNEGNNQKWYITADREWKTLHSTSTCLDASSADNNIAMTDCNGSDAQKWTSVEVNTLFEADTSTAAATAVPTYLLINNDAARAMDYAYGDSYEDNVYLSADMHGGRNQQWRFISCSAAGAAEAVLKQAAAAAAHALPAVHKLARSAPIDASSATAAAAAATSAAAASAANTDVRTAAAAAAAAVPERQLHAAAAAAALGPSTAAAAAAAASAAADASAAAAEEGRELAACSSGGGSGCSAMLQVHNAQRSAVKVAALNWSSSIAGGAAGYARTLADSGCNLKHSSSGYGENLYASYGSSSTARQAATAWANEKANYTYSKCCGGNFAAYGHYTQMVWRATKSVGCGYAFNSGSNCSVWVCRYDPPGNYVGQYPY
ncbi:CAP domain-containing protein [Tribonema minus]|uniref:CAP domain-containing protein n=1 Tax=Tribonema minus TaxID=303371 RepID=A0A835ZGB5_9STRA|nr:CAP domain-containing protein [Tribonema minus]